MTTTKKPVARPLPPALVKNAARQAAAKTRRLAAQALADVALIRERKRDIAAEFYDIGEALTRLKEPAVLAAAGYENFADLCRRGLDVSVATAQTLIGIVRHLTRAQAVEITQDRARALIELANATPEDDTPIELHRATLKLPTGETLRVHDASTLQIYAAAKAFRAARPKASAATAKPRGRTTTPEERTAAAALEARLHALGFADATVRVVATRPGRESAAEIKGLRASDLAALQALLPAKRATPPGTTPAAKRTGRATRPRAQR